MGALIASYGLDHIKLGMPIGSVWTDDKPTEFGAGRRFFDRQQVQTYIGARYSVETVTCPDGEVIVGIIYGDYGPGHASLSEFIKTQQEALLRDGVKQVRQDESGRDLYLWGIKTRIDGQGSGGLSDYLILRRRCIREKAADGGEMCSISSQEIHLARSKSRLD